MKLTRLVATLTTLSFIIPYAASAGTGAIVPLNGQFYQKVMTNNVTQCQLGAPSGWEGSSPWNELDAAGMGTTRNITRGNYTVPSWAAVDSVNTYSLQCWSDYWGSWLTDYAAVTVQGIPPTWTGLTMNPQYATVTTDSAGFMSGDQNPTYYYWGAASGYGAACSPGNYTPYSSISFTPSQLGLSPGWWTFCAAACNSYGCTSNYGRYYYYVYTPSVDLNFSTVWNKIKSYSIETVQALTTSDGI